MTNATSTRDEQSRLDTALADPDQLLLDSLRSDERRRRRRRLWFVSVLIGGLIMSISIVAALAGWLTLAAPPPVATSTDTAEQAADWVE